MTSPIPVRDAASVLLLRDDPAGGPPQVWMMVRSSGMVFGPGLSVFPGGRVDDGDLTLPWSGRSPHQFAEVLDCSDDLARALVGAAVRETFEETGVLLTTPPAELAPLQSDVEDGRLTFGELLTSHELAVDGDALLAWSRWITPDRPGTPRRYDTRFFVAQLPPGAEAADLSRESVRANWTTAAAALAAHDRAEISMFPPTIALLRSIVDATSTASIMAGAAARSLAPNGALPNSLAVDLPGSPGEALAVENHD